MTLPVTVKNNAGNFIMGVPRESFHLFDEKDEQPIELFENSDAPSSIGILIDTSSSMQIYEVKDVARPGPVGEAVSRFLQLGNENNEYFIMTFDRAPHLVADWTSAKTLLNTRTTLTYQEQNTALYDACITAIDKLRSAHNPRRVLLLISDGEDNLSRNTFVQLRELLRHSDISLYAIGIMRPSNVGSALGLEGQGVLSELAAVTGAEAVFPEDKKKLQDVVEYLSIELRHQYRLGFRTAPSSTAAKWHRLKLKITPRPNAPEEFSKLTVRTRPGYFTK